MSQENNVQNKNSPKVIIIALAIICVILSASLIGVIAINQPNDSQAQLAEKDSTISTLHTQIAALQLQLSSTANASTYATQIAYLNQQLSYLNDTLTNTNDELLFLQTIVQLQTSGTLYDANFVQEANTTTTTLWNDNLNYAGYVVVEATATTNTTYAEARYTFNGVSFDFNQTIGTSGTATFPVMPGTVEIRMGNPSQNDTNTVYATAIYYY